MNMTLTISGEDEDMGRSFQATSPALVFDMERLFAQAEIIRKIGDEVGVTILVAVKAVPHETALSVLSQLVDGFDVSNAREYRTVETHAAGKILSFTGPACTHGLADLDLSRPSQVIINAETELQLALARRLTSVQSTVGIRLRASDWTLPEPPFGFDDALLLTGAIKLDYAKIRAVHIHGGGRNNPISLLVSRGEKMLSTLKALDIKPNYINFGGGVSALSDFELREYLKRLATLCGNRAAALIEPGEYFFATCGWAEGTVIDVCATREGARAIVDLSAVAHLRWSLSDPIYAIAAEKQSGACQVDFVGPSCHRGDLIARRNMRKSVGRPYGVRIGDRIRVDGITCYSAAWNIGFAGIDPAAVLVINA